MARVRPTIYVAAAQAGAEGLGLVRNVLLARALGPSEMGVAIALTMTLSLLDMISDFGPDRLLVQAEDGDREEFQSTAHSMLIIRGLISAALLAGLAFPVGHYLKRPDAVGMMMALGVVPLVRGLLHLDSKRVQRHHDFRRTMIVELSAAITATTAAFLLASWIRSAAVLVWVSVLQAVVLVGVSHGVAQRPYRLGMGRDVARRLLRFGWPLAVNGVIMFGAFQGDRLVVLASATAADLGRYAVAFQMTMVPALLISRIASTAWLPSLSRCQGDPVTFNQRLESITEILGGVGLVFSLGILSLGNPVIKMLYGPDFPVPVAVMSALGVMQGLRILRAVPSLAALSRADSFNPLASNVLRFLGIAAAAIAGMSGGGLEAITTCGCGGEVIALIGSIVLLRHRHSLSVKPLIRVGGLFAIGLLSAGVAAQAVDWPLAGRLVLAVVALLTLVRMGWGLVRQRFAAMVHHEPGRCPALVKTGN